MAWAIINGESFGGLTIHKMLPGVDDGPIVSQIQVPIEENETGIWEHFVQEDLLFSKKENEFRSFVNYAPFAKGMPKESPGRVAYFIGYRIVSEYMKNNKIGLDKLISLTDSRKFLQESRYKPIR